MISTLRPACDRAAYLKGAVRLSWRYRGPVYWGWGVSPRVVEEGSAGRAGGGGAGWRDGARGARVALSSAAGTVSAELAPDTRAK